MKTRSVKNAELGETANVVPGVGTGRQKLRVAALFSACSRHAVSKRAVDVVVHPAKQTK